MTQNDSVAKGRFLLNPEAHPCMTGRGESGQILRQYGIIVKGDKNRMKEWIDSADTFFILANVNQ